MKFRLLFISCTIFMIGCENKKADMIIHNGKIYTMNDLMPITESVAIGDGKIIALGKYKELDHLISPKTQIINLNGAMMKTIAMATYVKRDGKLFPIGISV